MTEPTLCMFLMMRSDEAGTWGVTVWRDLGGVMQTWNARQGRDRNAAVLHVGFDRPPCRIFDEIAAAHQGRMLLTAAAKLVLPTSFESSAGPVGVAKGAEVFLGLQGWGYSLEDPTAREDRVEEAGLGAAVEEPQGWIAAFVNESPSDAEALSARGIHDESSYIECESALERSVRHRTGVFRAEYLLGAGCEDPCQFARAAPPWLADRNLSLVRLPVRVDNVFCASGIETVRDLGAWSPMKLLSRPNFGQKSLRDTLLGLTAALHEGPLRSLAEDSGLGSGGLLETSSLDAGGLVTELRRWLLSLPGRDRDVLVRRLGFERARDTLQQIAGDHDVTRERIRQIEVLAKQKWTRGSGRGEILEQKLTRLLKERSEPLPVAGLEAADSWFEGVASHLECFRSLVEAACKDRICFIEIGDLLYLGAMDQDAWQRAVSKAKELLSLGAGREWSETYSRSLMHGVLPEAAREFRRLLWDEASGLCHFRIASDGSRVFTSYGAGAGPLVEAILADSDTPLHFREIAKRVERRKKTRLHLRRVPAVAAEVGFLFGPGTYGLSRHLPLSNERMSRIRKDAEDIVCSGTPDRQWHASEIFSELSQRLDGGFDGLDKYVVDIALARSKKIRSLGRMTWAKSSRGADDQTRIGLRQAIISIVKAAGRPLSNSEIKERLTAIRGINETFSIAPGGPLVRVRRGVWGIRDRDLPLSREDQARRDLQA